LSRNRYLRQTVDRVKGYVFSPFSKLKAKGERLKVKGKKLRSWEDGKDRR